MSLPRPVIPGSTVFSTRRVHKRQLLLRPSPKVNQVVEYIYAVLAERHEVQLHALCVMSNHVHDVATDPLGRLPDFQRDAHALIARHLNALHRNREALWSCRPTSRVQCVTAEAIADEIVYTVVNPVAARLVDRCHQWPGAHGAWPAAPRVIRRPPGFFRSRDDGGKWPDEVTLRFHRPPGFDDVSDIELARSLKGAIRRREDALRTERHQRGLSLLGRRRVLAQSRYSYPSEPERRSEGVPCVAARSRAAVVEFLVDRRLWLTAYRTALAGFQIGDRDVVFPYGTFKMRLYCRVACGPPVQHGGAVRGLIGDGQTAREPRPS